MNWIRNWWDWLVTPKPVYPNPPYNDDNNMRGLGWAGSKETTRPFDERASHAPAHSVYGNSNVRPSEPPKGHGP